jgi:hypothetical protein
LEEAKLRGHYQHNMNGEKKDYFITNRWGKREWAKVVLLINESEK